MNRVRWVWMALLCGGLTAQAAPETDRAAQALAAFVRGNQLTRARDFEPALAAYGEALRLEPTLAAAWINRGNLYLCRQEFTLAITDYDQALRLKPLDALAFCNRGLAHAGNQDGDRAIADHDEALRLAPASARLLEAQKPVFLVSAESEDEVFDLGEFSPLPSYAQAYYQRGNGHLRRQEPELAVADYTAALRLVPDDVRTLINRGAAHVGLRSFDRAQEDFKAALRLDPNCAAGCYGRAVVALHERDFERAIAEFTEAISLEPSHAAAFNGRSLAWSGAGVKDRALADFRKALRLDLGDELALHGCAQGFFRTACATLALKCRARPRRPGAVGSFEDAIPWWTLALDLPPVEPPTLEPLALADAEITPVPASETAVTPAMAWVPAADAELPPAPALLELPEAQPLSTSAPAAAPSGLPPASAPVPAAPAALLPPTVVTVPAAPYDQAAAFWYSPAPIFFIVVVAALVLGASMVCIALLLLLPHFSKARTESIDVQQLVGVLLRERGVNPWQRTLAGPNPGAAAPPAPIAAPASKPTNADEELAQNILAENLGLRETAGSARE